ncbi:MAG: argininosuccinate lyase [Spirochaetota bacterium]
MSHQKENKKLWGGRFSQTSSSIMERIGESISFDSRLYKQDIQGSLVHAGNLHRIGILSDAELEGIETGLKQILQEFEEDKFSFHIELEDIHMHIEARLTELIGDAGKKLHTGRSRNDQIAQDIRLYISDEVNSIQKLLYSLLETFVTQAESNIDVFLPGYTHLQVAQPVRVSHYLLSYFWAFYRDWQQFQFTLQGNNVLVLGSGALAGVNYPSDRQFMQEGLGLLDISPNSIDAVSHRDNILNFLFASSQLMLHASRLCEEIILYASQEFSFIKLPDFLTTGSSIMPQKKNPDIAELIRGKSARVVSNLQHMMVLLKGLPLAYNRDLQEDKIALFDTVDQVKISLEGLQSMIQDMQFIPDNTTNSLEKGFATATDLADYLVNDCQIPFREAHELVGKLVSKCVEQDYTLASIPEAIRKEITPFFTGTAYEKAIALDTSTDKKLSYGSTSRKNQESQITLAKSTLEKIKD